MTIPDNETGGYTEVAFFPSDLMEWVGVGQAVASVVIACLVALIAMRQMKIAQNQLKLELFERRHAVFNATRTLLSSVIQTAQPTRDELETFRVAILDAEFLFDQKMHEYLFDIYGQCSKLIAVNRNAEILRDNPRHAERYNELLDEEQRLLERLAAHIEIGDNQTFRDRFRPFMQMRHE